MEGLDPTLGLVFDGGPRGLHDRRFNQKGLAFQSRRKVDRRQTAFQAYLGKRQRIAQAVEKITSDDSRSVRKPAAINCLFMFPYTVPSRSSTKR